MQVKMVNFTSLASFLSLFTRGNRRRKFATDRSVYTRRLSQRSVAPTIAATADCRRSSEQLSLQPVAAAIDPCKHYVTFIMIQKCDLALGLVQFSD